MFDWLLYQVKSDALGAEILRPFGREIAVGHNGGNLAQIPKIGGTHRIEFARVRQQNTLL